MGSVGGQCLIEVFASRNKLITQKNYQTLAELVMTKDLCQGKLVKHALVVSVINGSLLSLMADLLFILGTIVGSNYSRTSGCDHLL